MMKSTIQFTFLGLLFLMLSSYGVHRFYTAIYKIDFVQEKRMVQITTRIFIDDLNTALEKKYHRKSFVANEKETSQDIGLMKKYFSEKFKISINGQLKPMNYLSNEIEGNVIVCYLNIRDISKINTIEVENSILTEVYPEQQNIIQYNNNGKKQNLLLTGEITKGMLK